VVARFRLQADDDAPGEPVVPAAPRPMTAPRSPMCALLPNALAPGAVLFAAEPTVIWRDVGVKSLRSLGALKAMAVEAAEQRCA
jgi:hypothetical protein